MDCKLFAEHLKDFALGNVDAELHHRCESHMTTCVDCLDLWMATMPAEAELVVQSQASPDQILHGNNLQACEQCENQLSDYLQGSLSGFETTLIKGHLEHCDPCSQLQYSLKELNYDLQSLRYQRPPNDQLEAILARTLPLHQRLGRKLVALKSKSKTLYLRPRFSLEASLSASLAWFLIAGMPFSTALNAKGLPDIGKIIQAETLETQQSFSSASNTLGERFKFLQPMLLEGVSSIEAGGADLIQKSTTAVKARTGELVERVNEQLSLQTQGASE